MIGRCKKCVKTIISYSFFYRFDAIKMKNRKGFYILMIFLLLINKARLNLKDKMSKFGSFNFDLNGNHLNILIRICTFLTIPRSINLILQINVSIDVLLRFMKILQVVLTFPHLPYQRTITDASPELAVPTIVGKWSHQIANFVSHLLEIVE